MCVCVHVNSEVGVGRSSTEPLRGGQLPQVLTVEPWDGKDGQVTQLIRVKRIQNADFHSGVEKCE